MRARGRGENTVAGYDADVAELELAAGRDLDLDADDVGCRFDVGDAAFVALTRAVPGRRADGSPAPSG
jgi:hypothetical protein